jgi:hypothetical protein
VVCIDLGIDHRDENFVAAGEAMRLGQLEFLRRILSAIDGLLLVLRQPEDVTGLEARDQRLGGADVAPICATGVPLSMRQTCSVRPMGRMKLVSSRVMPWRAAIWSSTCAGTLAGMSRRMRSFS